MRAGATIPYIAEENAGRSATRITGDSYVHVGLATQQQAMDNLDTLLGAQDPESDTV